MFADTPDDERRFGGLMRLYGEAGYARLRTARVAVVGVGGVGSWAVEALARCGVAQLVLVDMDHVAESNINRQIQATTPTLGMAKIRALRERVADIHPRCEVVEVDAFVEAENWPALLPVPVHGVIDACDQQSAKRAMASWALQTATPHVCVGAAGGKRLPQAAQIEDITKVTHDPLLASLRQRLRRDGVVPRHGRSGLRCVYSAEPVQRPPQASCDLSCHGYGSTVTVTATFGLVAAQDLLWQLIEKSG